MRSRRRTSRIGSPASAHLDARGAREDHLVARRDRLHVLADRDDDSGAHRDLGRGGNDEPGPRLVIVVGRLDHEVVVERLDTGRLALRARQAIERVVFTEHPRQDSRCTPIDFAPMDSAAIRRSFIEHFVERGPHRACRRPRSCRPRSIQSVLLTTAGMQPFKPYFRGEAPPPAPRLTSVQKLLPRGRHRRGRQDRAPPHVLRDDGQLLVRRLLQGGRRRDGLRRSRSGRGGSIPSASGRPSTRERRHPGRTTTRASSGSRRASRPSASSRSARTTSGRPARRARAARAPSCTTTAAPSTAAAGPTASPAATATASSSTGTSSSCSTTAAPTGSLTPLPKQNIDTGSGPRARRGAAAGRPLASTRPTDFRDVISARRAAGRARATPTSGAEQKARSACSRTTAAA